MTTITTIGQLRSFYEAFDTDHSLRDLAFTHTKEAYPGQTPADKHMRLESCWNHTSATPRPQRLHEGRRITLYQVAWSLVHNGKVPHRLNKACHNPFCFNPSHLYISGDILSHQAAASNIGLPQPRPKRKKKKALALANEMIDLELLPEIKALKLENETLVDLVVELQSKIDTLEE